MAVPFSGAVAQTPALTVLPLPVVLLVVLPLVVLPLVVLALVVLALVVLPQVTWTSSRFEVPVHGSPNVALLAETVHDVFPTHAFETMVADPAALQVPCAYAPQEPLGVP
jgi:hypothetical protein